mmetsp:Transcript_125767/g.391663  ORF Transcript_125767/g.391663 Transcript_125767/m.391663 type:complete len:249 (-) Transcript_125767:27-773(-)|eukprot:CAMPEP_0204592622 /NCGR_PEP_ID=MMETSP0661-20131031/51038_1 /ASSEMBLY_ACC=CAM_ASM_000606 /TAXON_ID=109239 /ORGANISM="Alexandrium margalefi, Strain AMGDE01CS-322" /LENGTH=248 /DNA_ID=CAMNT_0051602859 /DNA_START=68 /DNA_END=814 /DNA_ORIENTATION=+
MARRSSTSRGAARRSGLAGLVFLASGAVLAWAALTGLEAQLEMTFVSGPLARMARRCSSPRFAESASAPAPAPAPSPSVALVKVTEESKMTTAAVLSGFAGLLLGGVWVGGALFAAASYFSRKEDDVAKVLKGSAGGGLEALNFGASMLEKYSVTDKIGSALSGALESAKSSPDSKEAMSTVAGFIDGLTDAVKSLDKDVGIKDTLGSLATSASDMAYQAVDKAVNLNEEYKVTEQIAEKVQEATKSK